MKHAFAVEQLEPRELLTADFTGGGQTVVVIDTGIAYDHVALAESYIGGYDFAEDDADPYDDGPAGSAGTHTAGILHSIAPAADLVALRVFDDQGGSDWLLVERALQWVHANRDAYANPITTVNLSLAGIYNGETPPVWAMLEDELAQLAADGILVTVAAGNSYTEYNAPGLSYPAASPYVLPVMSAEADGTLSYFTQRHERAIAAPGRMILSSVPDWNGNHDGVHDDARSYSGTSMAAPHVAGATVLVREALEQAGQDATPDAIYEQLRTTADTVFDGAAQYRSLNLQASLDVSGPGSPPPVATDDAHAVPQDSGHTPLDVLANDTGGNGALSITSISNGSEGGTIAHDGSQVVYSPPAGFIGTETFTYTISDSTEEYQATASVTVEVIPINHAPTASDATFNVNENSRIGTLVGKVTATDPDTTAPNNTLSYAITGGNVGDAFAINPATGQITVNNSAVLDFETTPTFVITVQVNDGAVPSLSDMAIVTVSLNNAHAMLGPSGLTTSVAPGTISEGQSVKLTGTFFGAAANHTLRINWGDGQTESITLLPGTTNYSRNHTYADDNPSGTTQDSYPISVTVSDPEGLTATNDLQSVLVRNVAPSFTSLSLNLDTVALGAHVIISGNVAEPGTSDTHVIDLDLNGDSTFEFTNLAVTAGAFSYSLPIGQSPGVYQVVVRARDDDGGTATDTRSLTVTPGDASIEDVHLFYNNSHFDNNGSVVTTADFAAIATDKGPLRFGETGSFVNISGYSRGINGIFIDFKGLPNEGADLDAGDFRFRVGIDAFPETWSDGPAPASVGVLLNEGPGGADRAFVTFADHAIVDAWLWVTILAGGDTGLSFDENFFFGAAAGETGASFLPGRVGVDAADLRLMALNITPLQAAGTEPVTEPGDLNRDGTINAFDLQVVALNFNFNALALITPQFVAAGSAAPPLALRQHSGVKQTLVDESFASKDVVFGQFLPFDGPYDGRVGTPLSSARDDAITAVVACPGAQADALLHLDVAISNHDWRSPI